MGSRVMHFIVSLKIAEQFNFQDTEQFLLGGISPDAISPKELSHFYKGENNEFSRHIAYEAFFTKYSAHRDRDYILGYYTHLITDNMWLNGFYQPWLKNRIDNDPAISHRYHHDFYLLNRKLSIHYGLDDKVVANLHKKVSDLPALDEVQSRDVRVLLGHLESDLQAQDENVDTEPLQVFTLDQIIGYIETAVEKSSLLIGRKRWS